MKVSVIVPVYNVENYLRKCLDSLVNQTLQNLEIIIVNDGSKDNSQEIIEEYQAKFPQKVKSLIKENGGLSDARNFGLNHATGDYIGFVDSDDFVTPNMFEDMFFLAQKHHAEIVICNLQKVDEVGNITQKIPQIPNMPEKIVLKDHLSVFSDIGCFACNKLFKKELFETKRFKKGVHYEDIQLIPQLILESKIIAQTQEYHYQYFERTDSISKAHNLRGLDMLQAVADVDVAFENSVFKNEKQTLKNFQILQGVYSFLAYLAFVKDDNDFNTMVKKLSEFTKERGIGLKEIITYKRFGRNYLLSLSIKKQFFYYLYFMKCTKLIKMFR